MIHRRHAITSGTAAGLSTCLGSLLARSVSASPSESGNPASPFRRCITLWMQGGPSQLDTFDPKPGSENGGPFRTIQTSVPGLHFGEPLKDLAPLANDLCLIRSVGSTQGEHDRATHLTKTGYEKIDSFPRPSLGSYVSNRYPPGDVPGFVTLGAQSIGSAFLPQQHAPFVISDRKKAAQTIQKVQQRESRLELVRQQNKRLGQRNGSPALNQRNDAIASVQRLLHSPFGKSLDLETESDSTLRRYGESDFGRNVLVARRLLESGVNYVEVQMPGWDTHVNNFPAVRRLCAQLTPAWTALVQDLKTSGLWDDTLIIWMGEFGRTPQINGQNGRDHYPRSIPVTLAGKSIGGNTIGATGKNGSDAPSPAHSVADLMYTLMSLLGIDADREYTTSFGSPTTATDAGSLIPGII